MLKIVINDLRIKMEGPTRIYYDNKLAINIAHYLIQHDRTKHIETDRHLIKEKLEEGIFLVVCTISMVASKCLNEVIT